jgi:hypothetical protein
MVAADRGGPTPERHGTPPNITGILQTAGHPDPGDGADTNPDAIYKAMIKVRTVGFFEPDGIVIHPNNYQPIRLLEDRQRRVRVGARSPSEAGPARS